MVVPSAERTTYPDLFRIPTFPRLASSVVLARTANAMMQLALVLFVLQRFHSPTLAGVTVFLAIAPGVAVSPLAGALLDRHGRVRLIILDFAVGALSLFLIAGLDAVGRLTPAALLPIVTVGALTYSLSNSGARSLVPLIVPHRLWDRANALDSMAYAVTGAAGPALAGGLSAWFGPRVALLTAAAFFLAAALAVAGLAEPLARGGSTSVLADAREGLLYVVVRNPSLRGLAIVVSLVNVGFGILMVALPVMVFQRLHGNAGLVGGLWALLGVGSAVSGFFFGRHSSEGRERLMFGLSTLGGALGMAVLALTGNVLIAAAAMAFIGLANGPADIALFSMRQRRTDPAWYGRAFAVSMALNYSGTPLGSAISGPLIHVGITVAIGIAAAVLLLAAGLTPLLIPKTAGYNIPGESARQSRRDRPVEESPSSAEQGAG
jgi:MFS family permease